MILVAGIRSESPVELVLGEIARTGHEVLVIGQRNVSAWDLAYGVDESGGVTGLVRTGRRHVPLDQITGVYLRVMPDTLLPEIARLAPDDPARLHSAQVHADLVGWSDVATARVVNRPRAQASNGSKAFQAQLIARHGFGVPTSLVTNDPDLVRDFLATHERVVYKSVSGVRSIVTTVGPDDLARLERVRACPVQFQAYVPGVDVRVHVVGDRVFATRVDSVATDYRYAAQQVDVPAQLSETTLPDDLAARCVALAADLELGFAGIDLKLDGDDVSCFEVNPSPGFSYFEAHTGQPIAAAVAAYLAGE